MKFSLITATVGRSSELTKLLESLRTQSLQNFELVVVDQNPDDRLLPILAVYEIEFSIVHCRSGPGLSHARNVGLQRTSGDIIAFPDDDCWYSQNLLESVARLFTDDPKLDGITGRPIDPRAQGFDTAGGEVDLRNVFRRGISYTIFLRERIVRAVGDFDESLGLGANSGKIGLEETDYLIRALSPASQIRYFPDIKVFHSDSPLVYDDAAIRRQFGTGLALGSVLKKHRYPFSFALYYCLRPLVSTALSLLSFQGRKARYHFAAFRGRISGWLGSPD